MMSGGALGVAASLGIEVGDIVAGKYRIDAVLGAGGMGVVFAARHIALNGRFALKFLSRQALASSQAVGRFYREAQAAAKLRSEHAVRVFDVGTHENGLPYIVMEYLEGGDLGRLLRNTGPLPVAEALDYVTQTCAAIADAHKAGIIHRDIKPSNLFCVTREDKSLMIKVLDFGISKVTDALPGDQGVTVTGNFLGSPSYMSPEQMRAPERVDLRSDIWSLGVVLYECLTAKLPFPASTFPEICLRVTQEPPILPSSQRDDLPPGLEAVILRCLEKDREKRFPSAQALAQALSSFSNELAQNKAPRPFDSSQNAVSRISALSNVSPRPARLATGAGSFSLTQPSWVRTASAAVARRRPVVVALLAAAVVVGVAVLGGLLLYSRVKLRQEISAALASQTPSATAGPNAALAPSKQSAPAAVEPALRGELPAPTLTPPQIATEVPAQQPDAAASSDRARALEGFVARAPVEQAPAALGSGQAPLPSAARRSTAEGAPAPPLAPKPKPAVERDARSSVWKR